MLKTTSNKNALLKHNENGPFLIKRTKINTVIITLHIQMNCIKIGFDWQK